MPDDATTDDPHVLGSGCAPTPFTAEEIRRGCPAGRVVRMRDVSDRAPETGHIFVTRFVDVDADGAWMAFWEETGHGATDAEQARATWVELQGHASFPAADTTVSRDVVTLPVGACDCLCYAVRRPGGDAHFWFAVDRPGMPVRSDTPGPHGTRQVREMVADSVLRS